MDFGTSKAVEEFSVGGRQGGSDRHELDDRCRVMLQ